MYAILCDSTGKTECGTDVLLPIDGRFGPQRRLESVREYRSRFFKNFRHKYERWTHCFFVNSIRDIPDDYNKYKPRLFQL